MTNLKSTIRNVENYNKYITMSSDQLKKVEDRIKALEWDLRMICAYRRSKDKRVAGINCTCTGTSTCGECYVSW